MKKAFFISLLFIIACLPLNSQQIGGVVNYYLEVDSVFNDTIRVAGTTQLDSFAVGDYVLFIQMTGATIYEIDDFPQRIGLLYDARNCGKYEFLQIENIITPQNYIVFTSYFLNEYDNGEKIQLVKVYTGEEITVTSNVQSDPWDGATGGIVAIMANNKLTLEANIDVNYQGFRGADREDDYIGGCRTDTVPMDTCYFPSTQLNKAGNKGEGIINNSFTLRKGAGNALNGGGGGNGKYSGGAGGSSYGKGGDGSHQDASCSSDLVYAQGGFTAYPFYADTINKVIFGGGGGAGTMNTDSNRIGTRGGNGGGIIFILADTLIGGDHSITALGEDVPGIATAGAGGGGGGGTILLDIANSDYKLFLSVKGGAGGDINTGCDGAAGGGGGGGVILHSGISLPDILYDTTYADAGEHYTCTNKIAFDGLPGIILPNLILPLNGFLFNNIYGIDTICEGQIPGTITGSQPKGGDGSFSYQWIQSEDGQTWTSGQGTEDLLSFSPNALDTTTYFRRVVTSGHPIYEDSTVIDSGKMIEIYVFPLIKNNDIFVTDTICYNIIPQKLTGGTLSGGDGTYQYKWERSNNLLSWNEVSSDSAFFEEALTETKYYKRIVTSAKVCTDTSETDTITVLPSITNNEFITSDTVICENNSPGKINPKNPLNGDGKYSYKWLKSINYGQSWTEMPDTDSVISPDPLADTTLYRRIVYSGNDNACIDTSDIRSVNVLPLINSNSILTDSIKYCAGDMPEIITGSSPGGGDNIYSYKWLKMTESEWFEITGEQGISYIPSDIFETTTSITRVVLSGDNFACKDTADLISLEIIPYIINILDLDSQSICENDVPSEFIGSSASGGSGSFIYEWLSQEEGQEWGTAPEPNNGISYLSIPLSATTFFARKVSSDICSDISDTVKVTVYKLIKNNNILGGIVQYTCFSDNKLLSGTLPEDGKPDDYEYKWESADNLPAWNPATGETPNNLQIFETSGLADSIYFRRIVFSSATNKECSDTSEHIKILINELPTADIISSQDTLCYGDSVYIKLNVDGIHSPWDVTVGSDITNATKFNIVSNYDSIPVTLYNSDIIKLISVVDDSSCYADTALSEGLVNVKVYEIPDAYAGDDTEVCGLEYVLDAVKSIDNSTGLWYTANGIFNPPDSPTSNLTMNSYGIATITWTETNWHCADSENIQIIFYEPPEIPDAGDDQSLAFEFTTELDALPPLIGFGMWTIRSGSGSFDNDTLPNTIVRNLDYENILKWTVQNGVCPAVSDSVNIIVAPLAVVKGFSPNGDGFNDEFIIEIDNVESIEILIFDRQGHIIFESDTYGEDNFWDGKNDAGRELPEGTYFYILKVKVEGKDQVIIRSYVELIR